MKGVSGQGGRLSPEGTTAARWMAGILPEGHTGGDVTTELLYTD